MVSQRLWMNHILILLFAHRHSCQVFPRGWWEDETSAIRCSHFKFSYANQVHSWPHRGRPKWGWWSCQVWIPLLTHENCLRHWVDCNWFHYAIKRKWIHPCRYPELQVRSWTWRRGWSSRRWRREVRDIQAMLNETRAVISNDIDFLSNMHQSFIDITVVEFNLQ